MSAYELSVKVVVLVISIGLLAGCAEALSDVVVEIEPFKSIDQPSYQAPTQAVIEVVDIRKDATTQRTTIGGLSMGAITLSPPETELIKNLVVEALNHIYTNQPVPADIPKIFCGIKTFDVETPATPLYWKVMARIELILRVHGQDRLVSGEAAKRTWVWPSVEIIRRVTTEALKQVSAETEKELTTLLAPSS